MAAAAEIAEEDVGSLAAESQMGEDVRELEERLEQVEVAAAEDEDTVVKVESNVPDLPETIPPEGYPESYHSNTHKETLVLGFVRNFERQFKQLYSQRKPLFTIAPNEFGVEKFVCTSIRPSLLPFKELYTFDGAARFVAEFLVYLPLRKPLDTPTKLVSPTTTMWNQHGNCFDFSLVLCSLLEGAGYDAYCVHGYATRETCEMDRARAVLGGRAAETEAAAAAAETKANKYSFKGGKKLESKFEADREKREGEKLKSVASADGSAAPSAPPVDPYNGLRVHCWVLVRAGKRDVPESFFIEPSTGATVSTKDPCYQGIEAVWNSKNYWVNMQSCAAGLASVKFDLADTALWEYIFPNASLPKVAPNVSAAEAETANPELLVLDLSASWVDKLELTPKAYETRCPKGVKTIVYKDGRTELFAEYLREDGLVRRITRFGANPQEVARTEETFIHRADKLMSRTSIPPEGKTVSMYGPGNKFHMRSYTIIELHGGSRHELNFFHTARLDGLKSRTFDFSQLVETFEGREDRLQRRTIVFSKSATPAYQRRVSALAALSVNGVITEVFGRNSSVSAMEDPARIVFDEDVISVTYHVGDSRITAHTRDFEKPGLDEKGMPKPITLEHVVSFKVDPTATPDRNFKLFEEFQKLARREGESKDAIMAAEAEMEAIVHARRADDLHVDLEVSFYDTTRNIEAKRRREELELKTRQEMKRREELEKDYLAPFLVQLNDPQQLGAADAQWVRDACLRDMKDRLVDQAVRTQEWLSKEQAELQQRKQWFEKNQATIRPDEEEKYRSFCDETAFRIRMLQQRLARMKETAPLRLIELETRLKKDPRLAKCVG